MDNQPQIRIECEGSTTVTLDELKELQGELKELSDKNYDKLRTSIINFGFSFPIFFWEDKDSTKYVIDSHQRKRTLMRMRSEEGFQVPPLPAVRIFAKDRVEAKEKLLALNSSYGKITEEGLYGFINEEGYELDEAELETFVEIDEFNYEQNAQDFSDKNKEIDVKEMAKDLNMTCPKCGFEFKGDKGLEPVVEADLTNEPQV